MNLLRVRYEGIFIISTGSFDKWEAYRGEPATRDLRSCALRLHTIQIPHSGNKEQKQKTASCQRPCKPMTGGKSSKKE